MDVYGVLADPTRRRILQLLREGEMSAGALATHFSVSKATLSRHFNVLHAADLIGRKRHGTHIFYFLQLEELKRVVWQLSADFRLNTAIDNRGNLSADVRNLL